MNYYEHHIRDYDTATAHLSWEEDLAYRRLIAWYYRKEAPIPGDIKEACRQVRAASKPQREAVAAVLDEFFELREDGWHNETCDDVISAFKAGEPEREAKRKNEDTRLAKHRAERSDLFGIINAAGIHLPWNTKMDELRTVADRIRTNKPPKPVTVPATETATPATQPATAPATPATATQTPIPNTQYPEGKPNSEQTTSTTIPTAPEKPAPSSSSFPTREEIVCLAVKKLEESRGKRCTIHAKHPKVVQWVNAGITDADLRSAYDMAVAQRQEDGDPTPINAGFLDLFVAKVMNPKDSPSAVTGVAKAWHETGSGIKAKAVELGIPPYDPEKYPGGQPEFTARVLAAAGIAP